jgi:hypothetical protein
MIPKPLVLGVLALACVTAAGGGAYLAVRENGTAAAITQAAPDAQAPAHPVAETEAVVSRPVEPEPPSAAPASAPVASTPAPAPRRAPRVEREAPRPATSRAGNVPVSASRDVASETPAPVERTTPAREPIAPPVTVPTVAPIPEPVTPDPPAPPKPVFEEVVVPASSVVGLKVETSLSSETARVEDRVEARVTREVMADGRIAIPSGSRVLGDVILVERGGKMKDKARLGVRFHTLVLADGRQVPLRTDAIYREGSSPGSESARKIGGAAIGGAVLGAIIGGAKGAAIGGATGAAGGSAVVMAGDRNPATLPFGTIVTVRLSSPATLQVEKEL